MRLRLWSAAAGLVLASTTLLASVPEPAYAASIRAWFVAASGTGSACVRLHPCALSEVFKHTGAGDVVRMFPGAYAAQRIYNSYPQMASLQKNVVVVPDDMRKGVVIDDLDFQPPHVTFRYLKISPGGIYLRQPSQWSRLEHLEVDGRGVPNNTRSVVIAASHTALVDSYLHNRAVADHVMISHGNAPVTDVLIARNRMGVATPGQGQHADCLQIPGPADNVRVVDNTMWGCANSAIIVKADTGSISRILIANNFIQGCGIRTRECNGYYAIYAVGGPGVRFSISNLNLSFNTIMGDVAVDSTTRRSVVRANVMGRLIDLNTYRDMCAMPQERDNVFRQSGCALVGDGDTLGTPLLRNPANHDLHLVSRRHLARESANMTVPELRYDADGQLRTQLTDPGADQMT